MGYCYGLTSSGRYALACDACGAVGGVRKRTCPHKVHYAEGGSLPYCYPSALCASCYKTRKATLHVGCPEGAAKRTAEEIAKREKFAAGDKEVRSAFGDWHKAVPSGMVAVVFSGLDRSNEEWRLIPSEEYEPGVKRFLSEYPSAVPVEFSPY